MLFVQFWKQFIENENLHNFPENNSLDSEVDTCKGKISGISEAIRKLESTKKGEASSKLEELELKVQIIQF